MAGKSVANQLNAQILVLVLKSLQNSHCDIKNMFQNLQLPRLPKPKDEALMNSHAARYAAFLGFFLVLRYFYCTVSFEFSHANFIYGFEIEDCVYVTKKIHILVSAFFPSRIEFCQIHL